MLVKSEYNAWLWEPDSWSPALVKMKDALLRIEVLRGCSWSAQTMLV
jgi:hypothetical protein